MYKNCSTILLFCWFQKYVYFLCILIALALILLGEWYCFYRFLWVISLFLYSFLFVWISTVLFIVGLCFCVRLHICFRWYFKNSFDIFTIFIKLKTLSLILKFVKSFSIFMAFMLTFNIHIFPVIPLHLDLLQLVCCTL